MIKKLSKSIREFKLASILCPLFIAGEVTMEVIIPMVMAKLLDEGINYKNSAGEVVGNVQSLWQIGLMLVGLVLVSITCGILAGDFAAKASTGFARNLRHDMYYRIQSFSFANIDRFSASSLVTRLTTDVTNVQNSYQMIIRIAIRSPLMILFSLIMVAIISPELSLVFLGVLPILAVGLVVIMRFAHPIFMAMLKTYDKLNRVVQENLRGIRVVKSFVREDKEREKFGEVSNDTYALATKAERIIAFNMPLMQVCVYGVILLLAWFGANLIVNTNEASLTTGELTSMFTYSMQILMNCMMLSMVFIMIVMSRASAGRISEVLSEESDIKDPENPVCTIKDGSVCFENVNFSYSKDENKLCLTDVNLKINSGETIGIIGGTGSSKSTLVQLIPRLYDTTSGEVFVGGKNVKDYSVKALRDAVSMVLQKNVLFSGTVRDNLKWGNENATDHQIERALKSACAYDFVIKMPQGLDTFIEQGGSNVSGGQKQRLCIARALLKEPKILILDDSTSAVDTQTDAYIRTAMKEFLPQTTKIIIAQRISSVEHADKIIVMDGGKISAIGNHEELLKSSSIYKEVYLSQTKGGVK